MGVKKRATLNLSDYNSIRKDLQRLKGDLHEVLYPQIFEINSMQELLFESLKHLKPYNRTVKRSWKSIENHAYKVIREFKLDIIIRSEIKSYTDKGWKKNHSAKNSETSIELFQTYILGLDSLPKENLNKLKPEVENHLNYINDLVKHYEALSEVNDFLNNRKIIRSHESKKKLDFYNRCIKERQKILDYYLKGIYDRAIEKSNARPKWLRSLTIDAFSELRDFPYQLGKGWLGINLDYRQIDSFSHRVEDFPIDDLKYFSNLYNNNKEAFYRKVFRKRPKINILENIEENLKKLPLDEERLIIFYELQKQFKGKKWLSFCALAIPQVEGLFSEISGLLSGKKVPSSLPEKVKVVRPYYGLSELTFDYYEYILPDDRNRFSHTGFIKEDPKLKAYDLLTDLEHITNVFAKLEDPFIQVAQIINKYEPEKFSSLEDFSDYFRLLSNIDGEKYKHIKDGIRIFNEKVVCKNWTLYQSIEEGSKRLEKVVKELKPKVENSFKKFNFNQKPEYLKNEKGFAEKAEEFKLLMPKIEEILTLDCFFNGVKKFVFDEILPEELKYFFDNWFEHKKFIRWIRIIYETEEFN